MAAASSAWSEELLGRDDFRCLFDDFIMNFREGDRSVYVERLRDVGNIQFESEAFSRVYEINLRHLKNHTPVLYQSLTAQPLRYLPLIEYALRDLLLLQELTYKEIPQQALQVFQDLQNRHQQLMLTNHQGSATTLSTDTSGDNETTGGTHSTGMPWSGLQKLNASSVIEALPNAASLRAEAISLYVNFSSLDITTPLRNFSAKLIDQLITTKGIVIQASRPQMKATNVVIKCRDCGHAKQVKIPTWRCGYTLPRTCEAGGNNRMPGDGGGTGGTGGNSGEQRCSLDPYQVVSELCGYVDVQKIKLQELTDDAPTGEMPKHLNLHCTATLVGKMTPGQRVLVTGVFSTVEQSASPYLHVLGVDTLSGGPGGLRADYTNADKEEFHKLANNPKVKELITASIAPAVHGLDDVKLTLACQLFGGSRRTLGDGSSIRGDIHILLLGDPSTAKSQVLKFVEKVAPVSVYTSGKGSSAAGLTAALVRDPTGCFALEGGAMVLADGGVVCIDEFDKMRDTDRVSIHEAMEQQTISIAKAGITCMLATECAVLAAANPTFGSFDETKDASEQHNFETTILSRFDAVWLIRDQRNRQLDEQIASHIFRLHGDGAVHSASGPIDPTLLKKYLLYCRTTCHPTLTNSAAKMLETFYVDVRQELREKKLQAGGNSANQIPITVRQLESITRLAEALAKMELQATVNERHVVEAMRLFKASTIATNSTTVYNAGTAGMQNLDAQACSDCQRMLLNRIALNSVASRATLVNDLKLRGFTSQVIGGTLSALVQKGVLVERPDGRVKRINLGEL